LITRATEKRTEALVADVQVPEVDAQVIGRDVGLSIRVDRDGVDVVGMGIGVDLSRNSSSDRVVGGHARKAESLCSNGTRVGSVALGVVVFGNDLDLLVKDFPKLDRLVCTNESA
jgi:hypothetical protein